MGWQLKMQMLIFPDASMYTFTLPAVPYHLCALDIGHSGTLWEVTCTVTQLHLTLKACTSLKLVLPLQTGFEQLPADLWARVLCRLEASDLLRAHLVSKEFVPLSNLLGLDVQWGFLPESKGSSLALFVQRCCTGPTSLRMHVHIPEPADDSDDRVPFWPRIMLASSCSNLVQLTLPGGRMDLPAAQTCLRLLPPTLECVGLDAPFKLITDPGLAKMQHLTCLQLSGHHTEPQSSSHCTAVGLLCLKALQVFVVLEEERRGRLDDKSFSHPDLTKLEFARDPFKTHLDLAQFPSLRVLSVLSYTHSIPVWLGQQPLPRLELMSFLQMADTDLKQLLCHELAIYAAEGDPVWKASDLLCIPHLTRLESTVTSHDGICDPVELLGSPADYYALLMNAELSLAYPLKLTMPAVGAVIALRKNGHALICVCSICRNCRG